MLLPEDEDSPPDLAFVSPITLSIGAWRPRGKSGVGGVVSWSEMKDANGAVVVFITASSREEAAKLAEALVAEKLAACVNRVDGVSSVYWWEGKVEHAVESLLIAKTRGDLVEKLAARVKELHSYTVPEVIALPILSGNPDYLKWIAEVTG